MTIKAKLNAVLEKLGVEGETAPEKSQDPLDGAAHEYNVAAFIASYGEARKKKAKGSLRKALGEQGDTLLKSTQHDVAKSEISDTVELGVSKYHSIAAQVKIGATYLDVDSLKVELMRKMKALEVDALFERHTKRRAPSVTYVVGENRDG